MSRSKYFMVVAGLFLGISVFLLAQGKPIFADDGDYYGSSNYFGNPDFFTPPPPLETYTYTDWGNETYGFSWPAIQYLQPLEPLEDTYGLWTNFNNAPAVNVENDTDISWGVNPRPYSAMTNVENTLNQNTENQYFLAEADSVAQTVAPPENNLFTRILGNWGLRDQQSAPPEAPIVLANNEYTDLQLPPNWGVSETRTDAYPRTLLVGGSGSDTKSQDSSDTVAGGYLNTSAYRSPGPQPHMAETGFSPKGIVLNAINYVKDFVTAGSATNVNVTGVGPKRVEVDSGGVSYTARAIPGGAYVQAEWNIDSFFRLVKPK